MITAFKPAVMVKYQKHQVTMDGTVMGIRFGGKLTYQVSNSNAKTKCQASGVQKSSPGGEILLKLDFI